MAAMSDVHVGWFEPYANHRICIRHLTNNCITRFKDKMLKNLVCITVLANKFENFNKHIDTIGRTNVEAKLWLVAIRLEKWILSHDGGRRYDLMTTNMSEVLNSVVKGARSLPVIALVHLTFFWFNSYFVGRRERGTNKLASNEQYTSYVDAKIKTNVIKAGSFEIVFYDHIQRQFHVKAKSGKTHHLNLHERKGTCSKTLIYGFPCSHILAACQFCSVDFQTFVQGYYSTQSYPGLKKNRDILTIYRQYIVCSSVSI